MLGKKREEHTAIVPESVVLGEWRVISTVDTRWARSGIPIHLLIPVDDGVTPISSESPAGAVIFNVTSPDFRSASPNYQVEMTTSCGLQVLKAIGCNQKRGQRHLQITGPANQKLRKYLDNPTNSQLILKIKRLSGEQYGHLDMGRDEITLHFSIESMLEAWLEYRRRVKADYPDAFDG